MKSTKNLFCICCFILLLASPGRAQEAVPTPRQEFSRLARLILGRYPGDTSPGFTSAQAEALERIEPLALQVATQPNYAADTLSLLNELKDDDGYARQAIIVVILKRRAHNKVDLPFLKDLFRSSVTWHYRSFPYDERRWWTASFFRNALATMILTLSDQPNLAQNPDNALLTADPLAWLAKYAP